MQIVRDLAGYSYGRSDLVRRAMAKKKHKVMEEEREIFVHGMTDADGNVKVPGCVRNGVPEKVANEIYDEMISFASYAFNKSHAAAYGVVAMQTAWLKRDYPVHFSFQPERRVCDEHTASVQGRKPCHLLLFFYAKIEIQKLFLIRNCLPDSFFHH